MMCPVSVASITTTYNNSSRLPKQIEAVLGQSRPLQEIIVVDNASNDGTATMLTERYPQITVLRMSENLGAAGAWAEGLTYAALQKRHDWVWSFDDDSIPEPDALENMVEALDSIPADEVLGILAALPVHQPTGTIYPPLLWREGFVNPAADLFQQKIWLADLVYASGCMVSLDLVEKIGLPRADFFMDFFDFEYCLRARSHGFKIAVVPGARLSHEVGDARPVRLPGLSRLWPNHAPWREYYMSRNLAYAVWWLHASPRAKRFVVRHLVRHAAGIVLFGSCKLACLTRMVQGFWDGCRGTLGVRFLPD